MKNNDQLRRNLFKGMLSVSAAPGLSIPAFAQSGPRIPHAAPYFLSWHRSYLDDFEPQPRTLSCDPTLNVIGGVVSTMQSSRGPIFSLHRANIDRLRRAWALRDGKGTPYSAHLCSSTNSSVCRVGADDAYPPCGQTISVGYVRLESSYAPEPEPVEPPRLKERPGSYA